ncbi:MAG: tetratricopeptide repeat protein [Elusimicrobia bacterium]|nr:tetratricopeptide repeat protein [Elusimicrobiota bacterium]
MATERFDWLEVDKPKARQSAREEGESFDARAYLQRAERAYRRGEYEFALRHYGKALREDPMLWEAWLGQVSCLSELGELEEARVWVNKAIERIPESPELLAAKGVVSAKMGDAADAMTFSDRAIQKKDPSALVWLQRGLMLLYAACEGRHESCFRKALEADARDSFAALRIGMGYLEQGDLLKSKGYLAQAVEEDSDNPLAWYKLGLCCEGLRAWGRAISCYERALSLKPEFKDKVVIALSRILRRGFFDRMIGRIRNLWTGD